MPLIIMIGGCVSKDSLWLLLYSSNQYGRQSAGGPLSFAPLLICFVHSLAEVMCT